MRHYRDKLSGKQSSDSDNGVLYSSGLVAGVGLIGVLLAACAIIKIGRDSAGENIYLLDSMRGWVGGIWNHISAGATWSMIAAAVVFLLLTYHLYRTANK